MTGWWLISFFFLSVAVGFVGGYTIGRDVEYERWSERVGRLERLAK